MSWRLPLKAKRAYWATTGYEPHAEGDVGRFHASEAYTRALAGGERSGKSCCVGRGELGPYLATPHKDRPYEYHIVADVYEDTHHEFDYVEEDLDATHLLAEITKPQNGSWVLRSKSGNTLTTLTGRDPARIRGFASDGIVIAEPGKCRSDLRSRCEGRLHDRDGWLIEAGTFEGSLHWWAEEYKLGQIPNDVGLESFSLPSYANRHVYPEGEQDPRIQRAKRIYPDNVYKERIAAIPAPPGGIIFGEFRHRLHVAPTEYVPGVAVHIWVDPGFSNPCAVIAAQEIQGVERLFSGFYRSGFSTYQVIDHLKTQPWWGDVRGGAIDQAARAHVQSQPQRKSDWDIWSEYGGVSLATNTVPVHIGIERLKSFLQVDAVLGRPRMVMDPTLVGLICELGGGPAPETEEGNTGPWLYIKRPDGTPTDTPEDRNNHACKATAYGLVAKYGVGPIAARRMRTFQGPRMTKRA